MHYFYKLGGKNETRIRLGLLYTKIRESQTCLTKRNGWDLCTTYNALLPAKVRIDNNSKY